MKLKQIYVSAANESDFGVEQIRPLDFWFEFVIDDWAITRENYYDTRKYCSPHWRGIKFLVKPIYIGYVDNFPQEAISENVSHVFSKITDYEKLVAVVDNEVNSINDDWEYYCYRKSHK
jgi:hypothetical protein